MTEPDKDAGTQAPTRKRRRRRWFASVLAVLVLSVAAAGWAMVGRSVSAPDWVRDTVEERLAEVSLQRSYAPSNRGVGHFQHMPGTKERPRPRDGQHILQIVPLHTNLHPSMSVDVHFCTSCLRSRSLI